VLKLDEASITAQFRIHQPLLSVTLLVVYETTHSYNQ